MDGIAEYAVRLRKKASPCLRHVVPLLASALAAGVLGAQAPDSVKRKEPSAKHTQPSAFFQSQDPIQVTLSTNIGKIRGDKGANAPWRPATLSYKGDDGNLITVPVKARTRGIWRLRMCDFPPLRLNFGGATSKGTIFENLDKPKLVNYCQDDDLYEQYVLQEYQLYRVYHLLTPVSHQARLLKLVYADSADGKVRARRYGFIMEEPKAIAARVGGQIIEQEGAQGGDLDPFQNALFGVFQYFIGNTDFSVNRLHNVELLVGSDAGLSPIAYDFDFAGAVNARYAVPDEKVPITSVRQRIFRGYCSDAESYEKVFALFNEKRLEIYGLYSDSIGKLMDRGKAKETLRYFDEFYKTINDSRAAKESIIKSCIGRH